MKFMKAAVAALALSVSATALSAACDDGEIVIKFRAFSDQSASYPQAAK